MRHPLVRNLAAAVVLVAALHCAHAQGSFGTFLEAGSTTAIDRYLADLQQRFEVGAASEVELRDAYRLFYSLSEAQVRTLQRWVVNYPHSYVAHLALGVYLKHAATEARGHLYLQDTPQRDIDRYHEFESNARKELETSMALTAKPFLSVFHMMDLEGMDGDRAALSASAKRADSMAPSNYLARERYMGYLAPRWGGSYSEMDRYLASARRQGLPEEVTLRLEAIEESDKALSASGAGDTQGAVTFYRRAIAKARKLGPDGLTELQLIEGRDYVCALSGQPIDCQP